MPGSGREEERRMHLQHRAELVIAVLAILVVAMVVGLGTRLLVS